MRWRLQVQLQWRQCWCWWQLLMLQQLHLLMTKGTAKQPQTNSRFATSPTPLSALEGQAEQTW
jgi:hypothetical protein